MSWTHVSGVLTTALVHGAVVLLILGFSNAEGCGDAGGDRGQLQMTTIEAALAYKSQEQTRQPQKRRRRPPPRVEPEGVSRDETKPVEPKKPEEKPEVKEDFTDDFEKYRKQRQREDEDEDLEVGEDEIRPGGQFDGSERGFAEVSRGDPYMQELTRDVYAAWEVPTLETGTGTPVGCVRLTPEGTILDVKLEEKSGNSNIDLSVQLALEALKKKRTHNPSRVPSHLLEFTTKWTCFKFNV